MEMTNALLKFIISQEENNTTKEAYHYPVTMPLIYCSIFYRKALTFL